MKKLILLLTISFLLFSCSNGGNASSNNNNSSSGNVDYYFKIKINGVEHKVQGNTSGFAVGNNNAYNLNPNFCRADIGTTTMLFFYIADITKPNYVSGQNLQMCISIPNCHIGQNQATVNVLSSPVIDTFTSSSGANSTYWVDTSGVYCNGATSNCSYPLFSTYSHKITLNITDMGTPSQYPSTNLNSNIYAYGNTFKGNYDGTIYFENGPFTTTLNCNIPMQLSMEFEAYRTN